MEHYYIPKYNIDKDSLTIEGDEAKHLTKVLRKQTGAVIRVTDGECNLYTCKIENVLKDKIVCSIEETAQDDSENKIKVTLYQSLLKNPDRFEFAIEKSVELGVYAIQPILTQHVISKGRDKSGRWNSISLAAMKQSQRTYLPKVNSPLLFDEALKKCNDELKLIAHEKNFGLRIADCGSGDAKSIALFIGPEGGFSDDEVKLASEKGFKSVSLGKRKFRSETAAIAALSTILL